GQGRACVKANIRRAGHQRGVLEAWILLRIIDLEEALAFDGMGPEGNLPWGLADVQAEPALEPLALSIYQRNQGDGRTANLRCLVGEIVASVLVGAVKTVVAQQRCEPLQLV